MNLFENICLGTVTAAAALLMGEGALFLHHARLDANTTAYGAEVFFNDADVALKKAMATEDKISTAADEESAYWQKTQAQVYKLITDTKEIMVRTDQSVNDVLVPKVSASLDASTALQVSAMRNLADTSVRIGDTIDALRPLIDNSIQATAAAAAAANSASAAMSDPAIHETEAHLDGVAGNLDAASADVASFTHRELAPVRGTWNLVKSFLREFAGPAAQVATAVK